MHAPVFLSLYRYEFTVISRSEPKHKSVTYAYRIIGRNDAIRTRHIFLVLLLCDELRRMIGVEYTRGIN